MTSITDRLTGVHRVLDPDELHPAVARQVANRAYGRGVIGSALCVMSAITALLGVLAPIYLSHREESLVHALNDQCAAQVRHQQVAYQQAIAMCRALVGVP